MQFSLINVNCYPRTKSAKASSPKLNFESRDITYPTPLCVNFVTPPLPQPLPPGLVLVFSIKLSATLLNW
ncbi:hypothetical protein BpHYR1_010330 [Brachionus plicatilis]|uniref:Uncharacterized protein n=1 Tax=Brachionus plicatilis TaxID=10195 RepID=A0A3M7T8Y5_BRAPC|nr:hypothetical protein BpHYR1_010330 [Brachionus plicatilis]